MIAISYRRQDSSPVAGRLYDRLQAEFGKGSVFMDFDSIPYGVDFREHIKQTLQRAKVVVAIIGPDWCGGKEISNRRIDDPTDFVRLEVASALENGIPIIPVLVNNTPMPEARNLPPELEGLAFRNGLALDSGIDFHHHADRLIAGIHRVVDPPKEAVPAPPLAPVVVPVQAAIPARRPSPVLPISILVLILAGIGVWYFLNRGPRQSSALGVARTSETSAPSPPTVATTTKSQTPVEHSVAPAAPLPTPSTTDASSLPSSIETGREHTFTGRVGNKDATFRLRFDQGGRVTGTYSQGAATYRLEGRHPKGKMLLDEYTGERVTSHIDLTLIETGNLVRWEGMMRNTPPDNRVLPIFIERSAVASTSPAESPVAPVPAENSGTTGDYSYRGTVGPYEATFQLRFETGGRVAGTYILTSNKNLVLRLEGRNPKGKLFLDEYTRDRLTAHIELTLNDGASDIRWEGTMYNTPPDNRVFPVSISRPRK